MYFIKEMPSFERPREKLLKDGVSRISNVELLAILLRTGNKDKSVIELSKEVIYQLNEISDLKNITIHSLLKIKGIKLAKAATIMAAIELGRRLEEIKTNNMEIVNSHQVYQYMKYLKHESQENLYCLFLNTKLKIIDKMLIYKGTVNNIAVDASDIYKQAMLHSAKAIILVHNHPTGNAEPSQADIKTTENIKKVGKLVDIALIDHIIIGNEQFYSFKEEKLFYL